MGSRVTGDKIEILSIWTQKYDFTIITIVLIV